MIETDSEGQQIDIEDLQKKSRQQVKKTARQTKKLLSTIEKKFFSNETRRLMGKLLLGGETQPDGSDWTMDDFHEYWEEGRREGEDSFRRNMARDMMQGLQAQDSFFTETENPLLKTSEAQTELIVALLERVLDSEERVSEEYPIDRPKENYWAAEALEVVRRTLIKPSLFFSRDTHEVESIAFQVMMMKNFGKQDVNS